MSGNITMNNKKILYKGKKIVRCILSIKNQYYFDNIYSINCGSSNEITGIYEKYPLNRS